MKHSVKHYIATAMLKMGMRKLALRIMWKEICAPNWPR